MTPAEQTLATRHRTHQLALEAATLFRLRHVWQMIDPGDLKQSVPAWLPVALSVVDDAHRRSSALARAYIRTTRLQSVGSAPEGILPTPAIVTDAVKTSLLVRGPGIVGRALRQGTDVDYAVKLASTEQARVGSRHALNGGRQTVDQYVASDVQAGWRRMTSGKACSFCSMLAGRGAVYSEATVGFQAHDGCHCQPGVEFRV